MPPRLRTRAMTRVFSTRQVSAADGFAYWREIICDVFVQLDAEPIGAGEFLGSISTTDVGPVTVSSVDARRHHVARSPRQIAKAAREDFLVSVQMSGCGVATQDGREAGLTAGDFVLYDTTRPYDLHFNDTFKQIVLQMPRAALDDRCLGLDRLTGVRISGVTPMGRIVHDFASSLAANAPQLDHDSAHRLGETAVDLLAVAFANALGREATAPPSAVRTLHLRRIKSYIESNLSDPTLSPRTIAGATHLSVRYVHELFRSEGASITRWIQQRRLERCRTELIDPRRAHRSITEIAYGNGFRDIAHFNHRFKDKIGVSPSVYRKTRGGAPDTLQHAAGA
jgi:AraC-like DNA-binding protein